MLHSVLPGSVSKAVVVAYRAHQKSHSPLAVAMIPKAPAQITWQIFQSLPVALWEMEIPERNVISG